MTKSAKKPVAKKAGAATAPKPAKGTTERKLAKKAARAIKPGASALVPLSSLRPAPPVSIGAGPAVLDRLWAVVESRRNADPSTSHSARLLSRGIGKVAQKFGEESVECLIEAVAGNTEALVAESADVLYHLLVMWVAAGVKPEAVWAELARREGVSGIAEKAARALPLTLKVATSKIP